MKNDLKIVDNTLELRLAPGNSVIVYQPDEFDEVALVECKRKRTHITLLDEDAENLDSKVIRALKDEKIPTFTIDNEVLDSIINRSSSVLEDIIALLAYHQDISQDKVDDIMEKISKLSTIYSPEFIITELRKLSERDFESFLDETDDTVEWFKRRVFFS